MRGTTCFDWGVIGVDAGCAEADEGLEFGEDECSVYDWRDEKEEKQGKEMSVDRHDVCGGKAADRRPKD